MWWVFSVGCDHFRFYQYIHSQMFSITSDYEWSSRLTTNCIAESCNFVTHELRIHVNILMFMIKVATILNIAQQKIIISHIFTCVLKIGVIPKNAPISVFVSCVCVCVRSIEKTCSHISHTKILSYNPSRLLSFLDFLYSFHIFNFRLGLNICTCIYVYNM